MMSKNKKRAKPITTFRLDLLNIVFEYVLAFLELVSCSNLIFFCYDYLKYLLDKIQRFHFLSGKRNIERWKIAAFFIRVQCFRFQSTSKNNWNRLSIIVEFLLYFEFVYFLTCFNCRSNALLRYRVS